MSNCVLYKKKDYIIVQNSNKTKRYLTVVNTKVGTHVHLNSGVKTAKVLVTRAISGNTLKLNEFMLNKLNILLGNNEDWNLSHNLKVYNKSYSNSLRQTSSHNLY